MKKENTIIPIGSTDLIQVTNSIEITNKLLYGDIEQLFNKAFCLLDSKKIGNCSDSNYLLLLETGSHQRDTKYDYQANHKNDYRKAISIFSQVIIIKPKHVLSIQMSGLCNDRLGEFDEAIKYYNKAIDIDPQNTNTYNLRGNVKQYGLKDYKGAIEDYTKAVEIDSQNIKAYFNRADAKEKLKDYKGAIEDYTKAVEIDPQDVDSYTSRGYVKQYGLKDYKGAIEDYTMAIEMDPQDADSYTSRGFSKYKLKDYKGAIKDYNKAIDIEAPQEADSYTFRGNVKLYGLKDYKGAIEDYTMAIEIDPLDRFPYIFRGVAKKEIGDVEGASRDELRGDELNQ